jgi:RNA-directed DNA polymerase
LVLALSLVWLAHAVGISRQEGAPFGGEAIVSIERIGPIGTSAEKESIADGLGAPTDPQQTMPVSLISKVRKKTTLAKAWRVILSNARSSSSKETRRAIDDFALDSDRHLDRIQRQLNQNKFRFEPARGVPIPKKEKDKIRPIVVAPIESRIVQRAIHDVLLTVPKITALANHPFSFGGVQKTSAQAIAAVPAAIQAVLAGIGKGAEFVIRSDITAFFTVIPKPTVIGIVAEAVEETEFIELFKKALDLELENLVALGTYATDFPLGEIGVAQGSSLSPLMGNILLHEFDEEMNKGACRCIRYIDDFLIMGPDQNAAENSFSQSSRLLKKHGLATSRTKTFRGTIAGGFEFLGIEIGNGRITPSRTSRSRLLAKVKAALDASLAELNSNKECKTLDSALTLVRTLTEVSGIINGWGHHYSFCNEKNVIGQLDVKLDELLQDYSRKYALIRKSADRKKARRMAGIPLLEELATKPFAWPRPTPNKDPK